ncbi:CBS domain-containing protein [Methylibium rhizosphaerae]|uniref:CBS domain-containing protein n=1 Tax=Methylibium rhizosphaerae TaxID=2570323 RepID=UPI00112D60D8|nr:CBS domain-containing protein [Methylibium rhizosphaerae]
MHVSDFCTRSVVTCRRSTPAVELARAMRDRHVGDVVVVDDHDGGVRPVGIVTDRDLAVRVMANGFNPERFVAEDMMQPNLVTAFGSETAFDVIWNMRTHGIRRLPVVDVHGLLIGIVTADDVSAFLGQELTALSRVAPRQVEREQARENA